MVASFDMRPEIEIKLDLGSFANYLKLIGFLGQAEHEDHHVNCFFDTEDRRLAKKGWTLRVRLENQRGLVTMKGRAIQKTVAAVRDELEVDIPRDHALEVIHLRRDVLGLDISPIAYITDILGDDVRLSKLVHFENDRKSKPFKIGDYTYDLLLDTTSFSDGSVDYELEVELPSESQVDVVYDNLRKMFSSLDIPFVPQEKTKLTRALDRAGQF